MSIPARFMKIARDKLDGAVFDGIYTRAVELERQAMMRPAGERIEAPLIAVRLAAHLNGEEKPPAPKPHAAAQIEKRLEIEVGPADLGDLLRMVREGGPNVTITRQSMDLQQELAVNWRGKHFVVIYSKGRDRLITAYPKQKKRPKKVRAGRPKDWRAVDVVADAIERSS